MLNKSGESGHPCLVPDFSAKSFSFSPLSIMLAVGLSYITFIMLRTGGVEGTVDLMYLHISSECTNLLFAYQQSSSFPFYINSSLGVN